MEEIENLLLETLSFYEPMNIEKIILDIDADKLAAFPDFDRELLDKVLASLTKRKKLKKSRKNGELFWLRIFHRRRSFFRWPF